nr:D-sedoheptulose 7-phosphate isomerase [Azospirillum sp. B4]
MIEAIQGELGATIQVLQAMQADRDLCQRVADVVDLSVAALQAGNKILFAGNGGSAADAQHWAGELVSRFNYDRPGLAAIALTTDTSILTAIGNDYGYDYSFARQIEALGREGDVFFALSTSGRSKNIVRALAACKERGVKTVGFTGATGGDMLTLCDHCLRIPSTHTPRIQEGHEALGHMICGLIEQRIFPKAA